MKHILYEHLKRCYAIFCRYFINRNTHKTGTLVKCISHTFNVHILPFLIDEWDSKAPGIGAIEWQLPVTTSRRALPGTTKELRQHFFCAHCFCGARDKSTKRTSFTCQDIACLFCLMIIIYLSYTYIIII